MARPREKEPRAREKETRAPPPPRMTGVGLMQIALLSVLLAVLFAFLGAFMAGRGDDDSALKAADNLGAGLCAVITAMDPEWWTDDFGSRQDMWQRIYKDYDAEARQNWPLLSPQKKREWQTEFATQRNRNKERLSGIRSSVGALDQGVLRGIMIRSTDPKRLADRSVGARIRPETFMSTPLPGTDVRVGHVQAESATGAGTFPARVYYREYADPADGKRVGGVYVIVSEAALAAQGGGGMWLFLAPLLVAVACGLFVFQANKVSDGIKGVARDLETIGRGKLDVRVYMNAQGEVGFLQRTADRMAKNLQLIQTTGSGDLDEALEKELDLATQIHQGLLPSDPPRVPSYEVETFFKVGRDIGGDYHDYIELDENRIAIVMADCSESLRGVPAAMVMAMTRAYVKAAIDPATGPGDWLRAVNRRLAHDLKSGMAVTALIVVLDSSTHEAIAASAGHRPIVLWRGNKTATINPNGIALGLDIGPVFDKTLEEKKFSLQRNDRVVLYTDGVISAENEAGEAYGEARFLEAVRRQGPMNSAAFVNFIAAGIAKFLGENEQQDDVTICTLKRMK